MDNVNVLLLVGGNSVTEPKPNKRATTKKSTKTALVISLLSRGPTLLDLPHEILHDIHSRACNPLLVEACKSLAHSLLPGRNVRALFRARYLLGQQRTVAFYRPAARRQPGYCWLEREASQALALGLKSGLLDKQVVQLLDSYAAKPEAVRPFRADVKVGFAKWKAMPRWFATRMLSDDPSQVDAAVELIRDMFSRGMLLDTGYTVLKMVQKGRLEVLRKLNEIGMPFDVKDGLAVEVAIKEGRMDVALYLLSEKVQPGPGAFEVAIERVCRGVVSPQQDEPQAADQKGSKRPGKRAAAAESTPTANKRARTDLLVLDDFCTLLLKHKAPISDKSLAIAIMAYPALSTASIREILDGMRRSKDKPSKLAFEAATQNTKAEKDLIPLLIEYGGVPEFDQVQGVMERLFSA